MTTAEQLLVRSVRSKTGLSQQAFAALFLTPVATLRDWEQGRFTPPGSVLCLLKLIGPPDLIGELDVALSRIIADVNRRVGHVFAPGIFDATEERLCRPHGTLVVFHKRFTKKTICLRETYKETPPRPTDTCFP